MFQLAAILAGMQSTFAFADRSQILEEIHRRLQAHLGPQAPLLLLDPVSQLVMGIIGVRTRGEVSKVAFVALLIRYGRWEAVRDAPVAELRQIIANVTDAEVKAPRLKAVLQAITAFRNRLALDHLDSLTVDQAIAWLERLPGVGRKVAAATLNFSTFRKAALVIDRHHLRVLQRLRLIDRNADGKKAYDRLMPELPVGWTAADIDEHHQLMKTLGQTICRHACANCHHCPLRSLCPTGAADPGRS